MSDLPFPVEFVGLGYRAGPEYQTTIVRTFGGHEQRNADWATPLRHFFVPLTHMTNEERAIVLAFVDDRQGAFDSFLFTDPVDGGTFRVRFMQDRASIETQFYNLHFWPDLEMIEVRDG